MVFPKDRVAIFVDGCFWHGCPEHGSVPKANRSYWEPKLAKNAERDRRADRALASIGWTVVRVWEHEPVENATARVLDALVGRTRD